MKQYLLLFCLCFAAPSYATPENLNPYDLKHLQLLNSLKNTKDTLTTLYSQIGDQELTAEQKLQVSQLLCEQYRTEVEFLKYTIDHEKDIQWDRDESGHREASIESFKSEYIRIDADYQRMQKSFKGTAYECKS